MKASNAIEYAMSFIGCRYRWGGNNPVGGWDCSGFACEILKAFGIIHYADDFSAYELAKRLIEKSYEKCEPKEGAILFFGSDKSIEHVAIALDEKFMIGAEGGDSTVTNVEMADIKNAFVKIRPISYRKGFLFAIDVFK